MWLRFAHHSRFLFHFCKDLIVQYLQAVTQLFVLAPHGLIAHFIVVDGLGNVVKPFGVAHGRH